MHALASPPVVDPPVVLLLLQVLFVCTANVLDTIPGPLLDRMEVGHTHLPTWGNLGPSEPRMRAWDALRHAGSG
jgi:hypothetical protein